MIKRIKIRQDTLNSLISDTIDNALDSYMIVDKRVLNLGSIIKFNLYSYNDKNGMKIFSPKNTTIDKEYIKKLEALKEIFANKSDKNKYDAFLENNIQDILQIDALSIDEKTDIIYESSTELTQSLYTNPNALKNAKRSEKVVAPVLESILYHDNTVSSYMKIIEYDYYTHTHSLNVSIYTLCLGAWLKLDEDKLKVLGRAALLHDLGKSHIDPNIVNKPAKLTDKEFQAMKEHPVFGYESAKRIGIEDEVLLDAIRHHHEKLDGEGYPDGLQGDEISFFARIIGVCDVFDALTTKRAYKEGMTSFDALILMKQEMSTHLDMRIVDAFIKMLHK